METPQKYQKQQILDDVARLSMTLMIGDKSQGIDHEPFYGHFFTGLVKNITEKSQTLAVAAQNNVVALYINPNFWNEYLEVDTYKIGALKHEILHIVFKHIFRFKDFSHKLLFNIAADLVVNQYIKTNHLVEGAVHLSNFPELDLAEHQSLEYYYNALKDLYQNFNENGEQEDSQAWQNLKSLLDQDNANQEKHSLWKHLDELSSPERDILESAVDQSLSNTLSRVKMNDYGNIPSELKRYLEDFELSLRPSVNWRRLLRLFTNSSSKTRIKNTIQRPSKRYRTTPGIKVKKKQKILIAIDTSGSVNNEELQEFFQEVYHVWKQGAEVLIVECDTTINKQYHYRGHKPQEVKGGGGTSFEAPLRFARDKYHPDAVIYFTDAYAAAPKTKPNCPIFWLISKQGAKLEDLKKLPGRKVKMNR